MSPLINTDFVQVFFVFFIKASVTREFFVVHSLSAFGKLFVTLKILADMILSSYISVNKLKHSDGDVCGELSKNSEFGVDLQEHGV